MPEADRREIVILGAGPAGWTAALYAARAGRSPLVLRGPEPGGQLTTTTLVENWPGFPEPILGPELTERMEAQALRAGAEAMDGSAASLDLSRRPLRVALSSGAAVECDALVVATGSRARWLGIPGEDRLRGRGVSSCATCDGFFFRGREVAVVGGGNTAAEEALYLAGLASRVRLVHRRGSLRAEKALADRVLAHPRIEVLWNRVAVEAVGGGDPPELRAVRLARADGENGGGAPGGEAETLEVAGLFVAIGHDPATGFARGALEMDGAGYLRTLPGSTATGVEGVFAAGDACDPVFRQAVTAAATGCMAALEAERLLSAEEDARRAAAKAGAAAPPPGAAPR